MEWLAALFAVPMRLWDLATGRRQVRFLMHRATFLASPSTPECYFLNLTNLSRDREVEVTHIWVETATSDIHVLQPDRPLPVRLKPDESWETWIDVSNLPPDLGESVFKMGRARLSSGRVIKSRRNKKVPPFGAIPGGPVKHPPV